MIHFQNIQKKYKGEVAVEVAELSIEKGESFGLVGNNGAGKTTLFRMLTDLIVPTRGEITNNGELVAKTTDWKQHTAIFLDETFLIPFLKPMEYLQFVAEAHKLNKAELLERLAQFPGVADEELFNSDTYIRDLSKGNQKRVGIVAALVTYPQVLILDEPFANLDPSGQMRLKRSLREYQEQHGATMLISSHDLQHVTEICNRIVVLQKGQVLHDMQTNEQTLKELEAVFATEV